MLDAFILWFLITMTVLAVLVATGVALFSRNLARANRVHPDLDTPAPLLWLWSPTAPARLHRRLKGAVAPIGVPMRPRKRRKATPPPHAELAEQLTVQAVELDRYVVGAARLPRPQRRVALVDLQRQVHEVEALSRRVRTLQWETGRPAPGAGPTTPSEALDDLGRRIDALEGAHEEVRAVEAGSGLVDPEELLLRTARPTPQPAAQPTPRPASGPAHRSAPEPRSAPGRSGGSSASA